MNKYEALLEPIETHTLTAIRAAFQAGWDELCRQKPHADLFLRNRLIGAIANLAQSGVDDPGELKGRALHRLKFGGTARMADPDPVASDLWVGSYSTPDIHVMQGAIQP